jgi:hypothetical protein
MRTTKERGIAHILFHRSGGLWSWLSCALTGGRFSGVSVEVSSCVFFFQPGGNAFVPLSHAHKLVRSAVFLRLPEMPTDDLTYWMLQQNGLAQMRPLRSVAWWLCGRFFGMERPPDCTSVALVALRRYGVDVPAWVLTPDDLHKWLEGKYGISGLEQNAR